MPRFCVLASGSSGNAAFLQSDGFGLLIDLGIGPRLLASRLAAVGVSWSNVHAALLTHVHADHWKDRTLACLRSQRIPLYCHARHAECLGRLGASFKSLQRAGLVHSFETDQRFLLPRGLACLPIEVPHDSEPTFAFRVDGSPNLFGDSWSLGYAADLGMTPAGLIDSFQDLTLLALEFNHDVEMEERSGRPRHLIDRVLGERGHLSNVQAAQSLRQILQQSSLGRLKHVVQLHLSMECNRPRLAQCEAQQVIEEHDRSIGLQTARQDRPTRFIDLDPVVRTRSAV
jgi:Beta-lactamase superfamily domain